MNQPTRCAWPGDDPLYCRYHDDEWGRPLADDQRLFEKICLEGFQAGLSWITILRKRENFRRAFHDFEPTAVARMTEQDVERLLDDAGIVRHRRKIESAIQNATRCLELQQEYGSLAAFVWSFEPEDTDRPTKMDADAVRRLTESAASRGLSRALKKRGWSFVGPTTMYAFLQSSGVVNDHVESCAWRQVVESERARFRRP